MLRTWKSDLLSSLVVFMVALPLCIAIAQACGFPAEAGIITGVVGGLIVGSIAGSPLQVSGPAAGLIVLVLDLNHARGFQAVGVAIFIAGTFQFIAGLFKAGQWFRAVSPAVIHGMLAGIGLVIIAKQFHYLVDDEPVGNVLQNIGSIPAAIFKAFNDGDREFPHHRTAASIGLMSILILIGWPLAAPRRLKAIPAALIAVIAASFVAWIVPEDVKDVEVQSNLLSAVHWIHQIDRGLWLDKQVWASALTFALIASAESLLCASAVDRMHRGPRTQFNRELSAQGIGNVLCGILGVLPMTGVIVRSAANVESGAKSRLSTILHAVWLLAFVAAFPTVLKLVPLTSLAAILVVTGYRLLDLRGIRLLFRVSRSEALILMATALAIVATDLLTGVLTGIGLAVAKLVWTFSHLKIRLIEQTGGRCTTLKLDGAATFLRLPHLADTLESVRPDTELHVDFEHLTYIDHACLELFVNWEKQHQSTGGSLVLDWDSLHARFHSPRSRPDTDGTIGHGRTKTAHSQTG